MALNGVSTEQPTKLGELRLDSQLDSNTLPGVEAIGAGYNPFLEYASTNSITRQIFDWNKAATKKVQIKGKQYVVPTIVGVQSDSSAYYSNSSGASVDSFQSDLANTVKIGGGYNFFSGSLGVEFKKSELTKSENSYSRVQQSINAWSLRLQMDGAQVLRRALRPTFRKYLDSLPRTSAGAEDLFNNYGSHFLAGIVMGGCAVLASATNKTTVNHSYSIAVTAEVSYKNLTGQLSASDQTKYGKSIESFKQHSDYNSFAKGGLQPQQAFNGKEGFDAWSKTVAEAPDFVNFVPSIPMAEIWYLCSDSRQSDFLRDYYNSTWAPRVSAENQQYADWVDDLVVVEGSTVDQPAPAGYTKIPFDLNKGAGGRYLFLCKHKASYVREGTNSPCIDDVKVIFGRYTPTPTGYNKLPQDLNKGAGGDYVYLCFRRVPWNNAEAIKDVTVIGGSDKDMPPPYDYKKVPGDLNKDAGGVVVYVCTTTG